MKTREEIIFDMCLTMRHDYGIAKVDSLSSGVTETERVFLWNEMAALFDKCIQPHMEFKNEQT